MENKPQARIEDRAPALLHKQNASAAKANASDTCYNKLLESTLLLDDEDEKLYAQLHDVVFNDVKPQSFLEKIAVKDLVDKLFEEQRCRTAIVGLIEGARHMVERWISEEEEREFRAIREYMPNLTKLRRMMDNSEAGRRSIMKELRRKAETATKAKKRK